MHQIYVMRHPYALALFFVLFQASLHAQELPGPGDLDPSFGNGGKVTTNMGASKENE